MSWKEFNTDSLSESKVAENLKEVTGRVPPTLAVGLRSDAAVAFPKQANRRRRIAVRQPTNHANAGKTSADGGTSAYSDVREILQRQHPTVADAKGPNPEWDLSQNILFHENVLRYGRHYGPGSSIPHREATPASPVDYAAYLHDHAYGRIDATYLGEGIGRGYGNFEDVLFGFPPYIYESMMADIDLTGDILENMAVALAEGNYRNADPLKGAFGGDVIYGAFGIGIMTGVFGGLRLGMYTFRSVGLAFGQLFNGDITGFAVSIFRMSYQLVYSGAYLVARLVRGTMLLAVAVYVEALHDLWDVSVAGFQLLTGDFKGAAKSLLRVVALPVSLVAGAVRFITANPYVFGVTGGILAGGLALAFGAPLVGGLIMFGVAGLFCYGLFKLFEDLFDCFITTAVIRSTGEPDSGPTLTRLRRFREEYVRTRPGGLLDLTNYERYAPQIVRRVERRDDADDVWKDVMERFIVPAIACLDKRRFDEAYWMYRDMFEYLMKITWLRTEPRLALPAPT